jgi:hypothetical protein
MKREALIALGVVAAFAVVPVAAQADGLSIEGRMFMRQDGKLDDDMFDKGDAEMSNLDYGVLASEMLVTVRVPATAAPDGGTLTVTVKQGKRTLAKRTWTVRVGDAYGIAVGHYPLLVEPAVCSPAMVITAKLGKMKATRTLRLTCAE